ncbi:hypothetical protein N752_09735 [Desulforamulus aquiferis]|nr:hypothetical protein N752_09735 [Desulforamulus aquiferis]
MKTALWKQPCLIPWLPSGNSQAISGEGTSFWIEPYEGKVEKEDEEE